MRVVATPDLSWAPVSTFRYIIYIMWAYQPGRVTREEGHTPLFILRCIVYTSCAHVSSHTGTAVHIISYVCAKGKVKGKGQIKSSPVIYIELPLRWIEVQILANKTSFLISPQQYVPRGMYGT